MNEEPKLIPLTQGKFALVDAGDHDRVSQKKWTLMNRGGGISYAYRMEWDKADKRYYNLGLHRFILSAGPGEVVDHINGDGLDNRRCNIRICTRQQNNQNTKKRRNSASRFKGVQRWERWWRARIRTNGVELCLGYYGTEEDAAIAYDWAAQALFGSFAKVNFPKP
jgi:hypothetical protein